MKKPVIISAFIFSIFSLFSCTESPKQQQHPLADKKNKTTVQDPAVVENDATDETSEENSIYPNQQENDNAMEIVYDMTENSFCIAMPKGWKNIALMHRLQAGPKTLVTTVSPDGNTVIYFGDPTLPIYAFPNPQMEMMYSNVGMRSPYQFLYYIDAETYFNNYIRQRFGNLEGFVLDGKFENKALLEKQERDMKKAGVQFQITNVSYRFHYNSGGKKINGVINGCTVIAGTLWLPEVSGFCTTDDPEKAEALMNTIANSRVENPQWRQLQDQKHQQTMAQIDENTRRMTAQHEQNMANIQASSQAHQQRMANLQQASDARNQAWAQNQASQDNSHKQFINSINNEHTVMDASGNTFQVDNYQQKYFVDKTNNTYIGTHGTVTLDDLRRIKGINFENFTETQIIR